MRRIAVINQKGGVGKTTTTVNLGAALAHRGQNVLLLDIDPQANLSVHVNVDVVHLDVSMYQVLLGDNTLKEAMRPTSTPGLSVVPSNIDLSAAELELVNTVGRENILRDALLSIEKDPVPIIGPDGNGSGEARPIDFAIIDCPPSLGLLTINALAAAEEVFIPVQTQFFALQGMSKLLDIVKLVRRRLNPQLDISGILPCLFDTRTRLSHDVLSEIREFFKARVFETKIRDNVRLAEAPSHGQTIFEYAETSNGAGDYAALADEVLARAEREAKEGTASGGVIGDLDEVARTKQPFATGPAGTGSSGPGTATESGATTPAAASNRPLS